MKRSAILITADSLRSDYIQSIGSLWHDFLRTNVGGRWHSDEILCPNPNTQDVLTAVNSIRNVDYSLVVFIGQGVLVKEDCPWMEMRIGLNDKETLLADRQLNTGSPCLTLVLDCYQNSAQKINDSFSQNKHTQFDTINSDVKFRGIYEDSMQYAERGFVKIYSTSQTHKGRQTPLFSSFMIDEAYKWSNFHDDKSILSWNDAVGLAQKRMKEYGLSMEDYQLVYQGGRRLRHFPLAIGCNHGKGDVDAKKNH